MATAAIVTGASRGIGLETAKALASRGYLVYGISRTSPQFSHELFAHKACDISDSEALGPCMDSIIADAQARGATIGALVNNAGYAQPGAVEDVPAEMVRKQFETNVFGLLEACRKVIPVMKKQRSGKIVNVSSVVGHFAGPYGGVYSATKHSIEALSAAMRMELREHGICVIVVNPGLTDTGFHAVANDLLGRLGPSGHGEWYRGYMARHRGGASPAIAAKTIASIVADPAPARRYVIGRKEMAVLLKKILPEGAFYSMVEKRARRQP